MGKKKHYDDLSKLYKTYDIIGKLGKVERDEYLSKMSNAERNELQAMHRQKIEEDEKARKTAGIISSKKETLATDINNYERYGEPNSDKHIDAFIDEGRVTKEEGEKWRAWAKKNRHSRLKVEIKESEKALRVLDPDEAARAIMNKNKIAGIEKAKATKARNKLKEIEENAAREIFLNKTDEELQAEREEQKRKAKLEKDPYIDELF